ncbi:hypothetical protein SAMN04489761_0817 [Tenacibaculum sp. MAR_2009_124]|nr:hypothetical protein SAMN04489761_0817 [Tenacibaculum sp. MAR_2009_124]
MELIIKLFLGVLGGYFFIGFIFGLFFLIKASKIDPLLKDSRKVVRFLLLPGVVSTWPFLIRKLFKTK